MGGAQAEADVSKPMPEPDSVLNGLPDSASEKSSEDSGQDLKGSSPPSTPERRPTEDLTAMLPTPEKAAALLAAKADANHEAYAEGDRGHRRAQGAPDARCERCSAPSAEPCEARASGCLPRGGL